MHEHFELLITAFQRRERTPRAPRAPRERTPRRRRAFRSTFVPLRHEPALRAAR